MPYHKRRLPRPRRAARSLSSPDLDSEFRGIGAPDNWRELGRRTVTVSLRMRVWASALDRLASLGFELRELEPDYWLVQGPSGDEAVGGDDEED